MYHSKKYKDKTYKSKRLTANDYWIRVAVLELVKEILNILFYKCMYEVILLLKNEVNYEKQEKQGS